MYSARSISAEIDTDLERRGEELIQTDFASHVTLRMLGLTRTIGQTLKPHQSSDQFHRLRSPLPLFGGDACARKVSIQAAR